MLFRKVALIGVGLLGGSLGLALRQRKLAGSVHGFVRRDASVAECLRLGAADAVTTDLAEAVRGADLLVFCTPLGQMRSLAEQAAALTATGAVVTDVGSVKAGVVAELEPLFAAVGARFVGSHPMAGSEKAGVAAARADLFADAVCVVTPTPASDPAAGARVEAMWRGVGGRTLRLGPEVHDDLVARASHLPQALAAALVRLVLDERAPAGQAQLCAGGFRDCTRIASGSPEMWRDIFLANREPVRQALADFAAGLERFRALLEAADPRALEDYLAAAKASRDAWLNGGRKLEPSE